MYETVTKKIIWVTVVVVTAAVAAMAVTAAFRQ